jgi:hypothetical protein
MKKAGHSTYRLTAALGAIAFSMMVSVMSCTKSDPDIPVPPYVPPVLSQPTGTIDSFTLSDSLVPYGYNMGVTMKWSVIGTNSQTSIDINGVKFGFYGSIEVGPLKQTTLYILSVNNGKKDTVILKVADSVTTNMWNGSDAKRLRIIKRQVYRWVDTLPKSDYFWVDTTIDAHTLDQRIYFSYRGTSRIYQKTANQYVALSDEGKFVVNLLNINPTGTQQFNSFRWQGNTFVIEKLDANFMTISYTDLQSKLKLKDFYQFE